MLTKVVSHSLEYVPGWGGPCTLNTNNNHVHVRRQHHDVLQEIIGKPSRSSDHQINNVSLVRSNNRDMTSRTSTSGIFFLYGLFDPYRKQVFLLLWTACSNYGPKCGKRHSICVEFLEKATLSDTTINGIRKHKSCSYAVVVRYRVRA